MMQARRVDNWQDMIQGGDYSVRKRGDEITHLWFIAPPGGEDNWARIPNIGHGTVRSDGSRGPEWKITESDGKITVEPSIWQNKPVGWHGFLRNDEWSDA